MNVDKAYVADEFQKFVNMAKIRNERLLKAILPEMRKTAEQIGMSKWEIETTYDAETLLDLYRKTIARWKIKLNQ